MNDASTSTLFALLRLRTLYLFFFATLAAPGAAVYAGPVITRELDVSTSAQASALTFLQATDPSVVFNVKAAGRKFRGLNNYTGTFHYAASLTAAAFVSVTSTNVNKAKGSIRFDFDAAETNTNGTFIAVVQLRDTAGDLFWMGNLDLNIIQSTVNSGASALALAAPVAHGDLGGLTAGDPHTQYAKLDGAETISGDWVNTASPWADNEVANDLTVDEPGIAAAITRDAEWDTFSELQAAVNDKTLVNEEDAATFDSLLSATSGADIAGTLSTDTIGERTADNGVVVDSLKIKDGILVGTPYCNKVVATHAATDDPTFPDAGTIADGDFVDLIWDTEVTDSDGVLAANGTDISFTRTGWAVITASYQIDANNNSEIYYRLMEDSTEYILFQESTTEGAPHEGWCRTIQIPITDASKVYKFQMCINTSDSSTDYPTGEGCRLHIVLWPDS